VSVRELVEFALRTGDLGGEREFVGSDRALAGIRGHQKIQRSRPAEYQKEIPLACYIDAQEFVLRIQGRLDGLMAQPDHVLLEEIKTVRGKWEGVADPLHWAQAKIYAYIYAREQQLDQLEVQLTYLNLDTGSVNEFRERLRFPDLSSFFERATEIYLGWVRERYDWCLLRDQSIRGLPFPFPAYRAGQRELAVAAYRVLARGGRLFLEAPTGIGKTISVLFPAVKGLGEGKLERVFYLTARTSGRAIAEKAFSDLRRAGLRLRTLTLTAKEKVCVQNGKPCEAQNCPLARGYYDRNKAAVRELLRLEEMTRPAIETVSVRHQVCPSELALDASVWADAVVCDYNYVFDPKVYLRRHFDEHGGDYGFLIDEAHNLVDRGRDMFSAELSSRDIQETQRAVKEALPRCAKAFRKLTTALRALGETGSERTEPETRADVSPATAVPHPNSTLALNLFPEAGPSAVSGAVQAVPAAPAPRLQTDHPARTTKELPANLAPILDDALKEAELWLAKNEPASFRELLLDSYFRLHSFRRTLKLYDERYVTIIETAGAAVRVRLFCLDPSFLLRAALTRGKTAIFFSATLAPLEYYRELLGGNSEDPTLRLPSPFPPEHLAVLVQDRIRTHFKARAESLTEVASAIGAAITFRRGNYFVFLPSYQYLNSVREKFQELHPAVRLLVQRPGMSESEREEFLAAFSTDHQETLVGFAVLGGVFGEGIDLVGDRLIGAIIVGVGLPQLSLERDLIRAFFQEKESSGFDYAYTVPGMNRVLQATGRVIRTETDRGVILLIDARFGESRYRRLLPAWWRATRVRSESAVNETLARFWGNV
jgi:DNA excision repair protein ERCC-2